MGLSLNWGWRRDQLADLERMLYLLDGKTIPITGMMSLSGLWICAR
jgi:hypothetical protein